MHRYEERHQALADLKPFLDTESHVSELGIFGSYARGDQTDESDLDVLVTFDRPVSLLDLVRLENELGDRLGVEVDVVTKRGLKPRVEARVVDDVVYV